MILILLIGVGFELPCDSSSDSQDPEILLSGLEAQIKDEIFFKYFKIWKKEFKARNNISDYEFAKHISFRRVFNHRGSILDIKDNLWVEYFVTIGWFKSLNVDSFLIKYPSDSIKFKHLNINRGVYLSEDGLYLIFEKTNYRDIGKANIKAPLFYSTQKEAVEKLHKILGNASFSDDKIEYKIINGEPFMSVYAVVDYKKNSCREGSINLLTGVFTVKDTVCRMY